MASAAQWTVPATAAICCCKPSPFGFEFPMAHAFRPVKKPVEAD